MLALGLAMAVWPEHWPPHTASERQRRLEALAGGAPERFFEEERQLRAYQPTAASRLA